MSTSQLSPTDVASHVEISQVLFRSLRCADEKKWDEWAACFDAQLTIDFGGVKPAQIVTPSDLTQWSRPAYAKVTTQHMSFNLEITLEGDRATSSSYGHARHERTDNADFWHIYAKYEHEYVRTPRGWVIARIRMTPLFQDGNPKLLEETYAAATGS